MPNKTLPIKASHRGSNARIVVLHCIEIASWKQCLAFQDTCFEKAGYLKLRQNAWQSSRLSLLSADITGMSHTWLKRLALMYTDTLD